MLKGAVARRYAEAVFEIGVERQTLDDWLNDVRLIAEYFQNRQLTFILGEPNVRFERKEAIVRDLLADKVKPEALGYALTLVERGIPAFAPRVRDEFERLYNEYRGQAIAEVTTATPLDDASRASVMRQMEDLTGKRIILREKVDPSLLGGAILRVGDSLIDGSVRRKLELLRRQIAQGGDFGAPLEGFDDLRPLVDLPGTGGAAKPLPGMPGSGNGATASSGSGGGPSNSMNSAPRSREAPHLAPGADTRGQSDRRGYAHTKRGKGRRR